MHMYMYLKCAQIVAAINFILMKTLAYLVLRLLPQNDIFYLTVMNASRTILNARKKFVKKCPCTESPNPNNTTLLHQRTNLQCLRQSV